MRIAIESLSNHMGRGTVGTAVGVQCERTSHIDAEQTVHLLYRADGEESTTRFLSRDGNDIEHCELKRMNCDQA